MTASDPGHPDPIPPPRPASPSRAQARPVTAPPAGSPGPALAPGAPGSDQPEARRSPAHDTMPSTPLRDDLPAAGAAPAISVDDTASGSSWPYLLLALFMIVLDQVTKYLVIDHFEYAERMPVIPGFFDLTLLYNPGAAFSFLADHGGWQRWFFTLIAVVVSGLLVTMLVRHRGSTMFNTAIGLVLGGAIGNLIDRLLLGHVTDFLLFHHGSWAFPAFNVADCAITIGAVLWILDEVLQTLQTRRAS